MAKDAWEVVSESPIDKDPWSVVSQSMPSTGAGAGRGSVNPDAEDVADSDKFQRKKTKPVASTDPGGNVTWEDGQEQPLDLSAGADVAAQARKDAYMQSSMNRLRRINPGASDASLRGLAESEYNPDAKYSPPPADAGQDFRQRVDKLQRNGMSRDDAIANAAFAVGFNARRQMLKPNKDGERVSIGQDPGVQNTQEYMDAARKDAITRQWEEDHPIANQLADIAGGAYTGLIGTARRANQLAMTLGSIATGDGEDAVVDRIAADTKAAKSDYHPTTAAGRFAEALVPMLPSVAGFAVNPVLGASVAAGQFGWDAGTNAIDQGKSLDNARWKTIFGGALGSVAGEVLNGATLRIAQNMPFIGKAFAGGAADSYAGVANRVLQSVAVAGANVAGTRAGDYAADRMTGESTSDPNASYNRSVDMATEVAPMLFLGIAHAVPEYARRNEFSSNGVFRLGQGEATTVNVSHSDGSLFSSPKAAQEFIAKNEGDLGSQPATVKPITERMVNPESKTDNTLGYAVDVTESAKAAADEVADLLKRAAALAKTGGVTPLSDADKTSLEGQARARLSELDEKSNGTPDKQLPDESGVMRTIPGRPKELLTADEVAERTFLRDALNPQTDDGFGGAGVNHQALARKLGYIPESMREQPKPVMGQPKADPLDVLKTDSVDAAVATAEDATAKVNLDTLSENLARQKAVADERTRLLNMRAQQGSVFTLQELASRHADKTDQELLDSVNTGEKLRLWQPLPGEQMPKAMQFIQEFVKRTGSRVVLIDGGEGSLVNGFYHDGVTYLNARSKRAELAVFGHEFAHNMRDADPAAFKGLADDLMDAGLISEDAIAAKLKLSARNRDEAIEEVVADMMGNRLNDRSFWTVLAKKNPDGFVALYNRIKQFFKSVFSGEKPGFDTELRGSELEIAMKMIDDVAHRFIAENLVDAHAQRSAREMLDGMDESGTMYSKEKKQPKAVEVADFNATKDEDIKKNRFNPEAAYPQIGYQKFGDNGDAEAFAKVGDVNLPMMTSRDGGFGISRYGRARDYFPDSQRGAAQPHTDQEGHKVAYQRAWNQRFASSIDLFRRKYDFAQHMTPEDIARVNEAWSKISDAHRAFELGGTERGDEGNTVERVARIANDMLDGTKYEASVDRSADYGEGHIDITVTDKVTGSTGTATIEHDTDKNVVVMHTDHLQQDSGIGKPIYQIGHEFAKEVGATIESDNTLLGANNYRRTDQMFSGAMRSGTTDVMQPGAGQRVYGWERGGDKAKNVARLAVAGLRNVTEMMPKISRLSYNPEDGKFYLRGKPENAVNSELAESIVKTALADQENRSYGLSRSTIARAAITQDAIDGNVRAPQKLAKPILYSKEQKRIDPPVVSLHDFIGKKVFGIKADLLDAGRMYTGMDGSKITVPISLDGGPGFPSLAASQKLGAAWAVRGDAMAKKMAKLVAQSDYVLVHAMTPDSHLSNTTSVASYLATLEAYLRDGRIGAHNIEVLDGIVRSYTYEAKANDKKTGEKTSVTKQPFANFPGFGDKGIYEYIDKMSFENRSKLMDALSNKSAAEHGIPNMERFARNIIDPAYAGSRTGDAILVLKIDKSNPIISPAKGERIHPSYELGLRGTIVGRLAKPVNYENIFRDYFENDVPKMKSADSAWYAFDRKFPIQEITPEIASTVTPGGYDSIRSAKHAQVAADFAADNWQTKSKDVKKGGVSIQEFADALAANDGAAALTMYKGENLNSSHIAKYLKTAGDTIDSAHFAAWLTTNAPQKLLEKSELIDWLHEQGATVSKDKVIEHMQELDATNAKHLISTGKMELFQLGKEGKGHQIFFALKKGAPWYKDMLPDSGITDHEVELVGVTNNEIGAPGMGMPAIMTKAIERGATILDAFAVKSERFPNGFLPEMYSRFGFKKVGEIKFDPSYYTDNQLADLKAFWENGGWKESDGYPNVVVMKWKGNDDDRARTVERYIREAKTGLYEARAGFTRAATADALGQRDRADSAGRGSAGADDSEAGRAERASNAAPLVARAHASIQELTRLTDSELRNLGVDPADVASIKSKLAAPMYSLEASPDVRKGYIKRTVQDLVDAAKSQSNWKDWYKMHEAVLNDVFGEDAPLFQKLLSATSQATGVAGNVTLALKAYKQLKSGQPFDGYLAAVAKNLDRIRNDEALSGAKISEYGKANDGDTGGIAVDRHIAELLFDTKLPNKAQIESAKARIREVANELGWEPRQVQAALWAFNQVRKGTDPAKVQSYDAIIRQREQAIRQLRSELSAGEAGGIRSTGADAGETAAQGRDAGRNAAPVRYSIEPHWKSDLQEGVDEASYKALPASGWKDYLTSLINKGKAKRDEVFWSGIEDWLSMQQGKVTKQQVSDFIKNNGVRIEETVLGESKPMFDVVDQDTGRVVDTYRTRAEAEDHASDYDGHAEVKESATPEASASKYDQYTLPGGENYRELLLTLPTAKEVWNVRQKGPAWEVYSERQSLGTFPSEGIARDEANFRNRTASPDPARTYRSSHWSQPNVLAHLRVNDRTDADGKRVLFVEEVQSDWGQDGKKKGFSLTADDLVAKPFDGGMANRWEVLNKKTGERVAMAMGSNEQEAINNGLAQAPGVPTAPFVTKTEGWLNLALKRVIKMAVDEGYDRVAFVNGEQSAERYDLSKQVESVSWRSAQKDRATITITPKNGPAMVGLLDTTTGVFPRFESASFGGQSLEDVLGKEMAERVMASPDGNLSGDGLKVGGEGMKAFYDKIVPNAVRDLLKKLKTGAELGQVDIGRLKGDGDSRYSMGPIDPNKAQIVERAPGVFQVWATNDRGVKQLRGGNFDTREQAERYIKDMAAGQTQPGFDVTDKMRERASTGLPLFSKELDKVVDGTKKLGKEAIGFLAPMTVAPKDARGIIKQFANDRRVASYQFSRLDEYLTKNFDKAQLEKMWNAADEENDLRRTAATPAQMKGAGLDRLDPKERAIVEVMHQYGERLMQRAQAAGLFQNGTSVPFWTPRMMVMIDQNGDFKSPGGERGSDPDGLKFATTSGSMKQRKYVTSSDTEAAMQALGGEMVRDIRTMPLAMARFERAIASREFVNGLRDMDITQTWISKTGGDGYVVARNGVFDTLRIKTTQEPWTDAELTAKNYVVENGKVYRFVQDPNAPSMARKVEVKAFTVHPNGLVTREVPLVKDGKPQFDREPAYIRKDVDDALRAVLSSNDGTAYSAYMLLKSKAMSAIMVSPLIHNMVIGAKALAMHPLLTATGLLYVRGNAARKNPDVVEDAIRNGVVLLAQHNTAIDLTDIANPLGRDGGWGDQNESWLNLTAQAVGNKASKMVGGQGKAGDAIKSKLDKVGDFWHGTLLWQRIADLQMGIYTHTKAELVSKGYSDRAAGIVAAHMANRYGGALPKENMSELARKSANIILFSRSFTLGNLGIIKDMAAGLPAGEKALLEMEMGRDVKRGVNLARRKAIAGFIMDIAMMYIGTSLVQDAIDEKNKGRSLADIGMDYVKRGNEYVARIKADPTDIGNYDPLHLFSQGGNEPGKHERAKLGMSDSGRMIYLRVPTGKVAEELVGWLTHPSDIFSAKLSPTVKSIYQASVNDKGFGKPVYDESAGFINKLVSIAKHIASAHINSDVIENAIGVMSGKASDVDKLRLWGTATGFSPSQGYPGGPEAGVIADERKKYDQRVLVAKEKALQQIKFAKYSEGDESAQHAALAEQILMDAGMTSKEARKYVNQRLGDGPSGPSKSAKKWFQTHGTESGRNAMDQLSQ